MSNRWFKLTVVGLAGILVAILAAGALVFGTEPGSRWLLRFAAERAPGSLAIDQVQGTFLAGLRLQGIRYQDEGTTATVEQLSLQWRPAALVQRSVEVTRLRLSGLRLSLPPAEDRPAEPAGPLPLPVRLPLGIELQDAELTDLQVRRGDQDLPRLDRVALAGSVRDSRVRLAQLSVAGPDLRLEAHGSVRLSERLPVDVEAEWGIRRQEQWWTGAGRLVGDRASVRLEQALRTPVVARLQAEIDTPLDQPRWRAELRVPETALRRMGDQLPEAAVELTATGEGTDTEAQAEVTGGWSQEETGRLVLAAQVRFADQVLHLEPLSLRGPEAAALRVEGRVGFAGDAPSVDISGSWESLQWPLRGAAQVTSGGGEYRLEGAPDDYRFQVNADLAGEGLAPGRWRLAGAGDAAGVQLRELQGQVLEGTVDGRGVLTWDPLPSWQGELQWRDIDPGWYAAEWSGSLHGRVQVRGELPDSGLQLAAELTDAGGLLRGREFSASASGSVDGEEVQLQALDLRSGSAWLQAEGRYGAQMDLQWQFDADALGDLLPDAEGSLGGRGRIQGTPEQPVVEASAEGHDLRWREYEATHLKADVALPAAPGEPLNLDVVASGLELGKRTVERITVAAEGPTQDHRLRVEVRAPEGSVRSVARGSWDGQAWDGQLRELRLETPQLGAWAMTQPAALQVAREGIALERSCLAQDQARLCVGVRWDAEQRLQGELEVVSLPLALFAFAWPDDLTISGELNGAGELALVGEQLQAAQGDFRLGPGQARLDSEATGPVEWAFGGGRLQVTRGQDALVGQLDLDLGRDGATTGEVRLGLEPTLSWPERPLDGALEARLGELELIEILVPQLTDLEGSLQAGVTLDGTLSAPRVRPAAQLALTRAGVPPLGLTLEDLDVRLQEAAPGRIALRGQVRSGPGRLNAEGEIRLGTGDPWALELALSGKDFQVADTAETRVLASPELQIAASPGEAEITGSIVVPEAHLAPRAAAPAVRTSPDVVVVGGEREEQVAEERWRTIARVRLELGDKVFFEGFGFQGRVGGAVTLVDQPERITIATGTLEVHDASYTAYGQDLQVEQGRVVYSESPVINPGLDFTAVREVDEVRVGVRVTGTALDPRLSLFSVPTMPESDILAYLVVGRPLERVSGAEGDAVMSAATSAGLAGGGLLAERIGERLGIEDVSVERAAGSEQPWLTVGKYLSPKLYMSYGVGLFESGTMVTLRYELNEHWRVQGQSGEASGADIIWTIER